MQRKEMIEKLAGYFNKQAEIKVAYLFGSMAKGRAGRLSDVDIAIFIDERLERNKRNDLQLKILSDLIALLNTDKIDIVVMNELPILMKYNIIKNGIILKDDEERAKIEAKILSEYLDRKYYIDRHTKIALKRIAEKGLI
ncbi:MAG TPA: nucleotidyltransferase domain-containing protein [Thermoplasmatales archaeon]|nr:nucleotidyltransferase domain-containing protein [Thermoplasmatales archaeon]